MKFFDRYRLSLHNINNNRSRSILTTIIVYVISLLLTAIIAIGISFSSNLTEIMKAYYSNSNTAVYTAYNNYSNENILGSDKYDDVFDVVMEHEDAITHTMHRTSVQGDITFQDHRFPITKQIELLEGRLPTASDENTNKVLVSANYANLYYLNNNIVLKPGSKFEYSVYYYDYDHGCNYVVELEVIGIFMLSDSKDNILESNTEVIADLQYILSTNDDIHVEQLYYYYDVSKIEFSISELRNRMISFEKDLKNVVGERENTFYVFGDAASELQSMQLFSIIVIALAFIFTLVLILLSIGSLANTIMISVDKNKKFIGLLKALGLNEKDLKSVIKMESITTICLGVILAFLTLVLASPILGGLNELLIDAMFSSYIHETGYQITFAIPIYVPVIIMIFFIAFTLIFARGSMAKIAKTDPMAVISEVA